MTQRKLGLDLLPISNGGRVVWVYQYFAHRSFAAALREGVAPSPGFDDALLAHALVEAAYRSCATGRREDIAPLLA